jgi:4-amino-4-deoxy-L-arabinose transferase-like glycosyltransferase
MPADDHPSPATGPRVDAARVVNGLPGLGWWLAALVIVGLVLRLAGISFGLPWVDARPDERNILVRAITISAGELNPHYFNYPSGFFYLAAGLAWIEAVVTVGLGNAESVRSFLTGFFLDPTPFVLTVRIVSAIASAVTILATFRLGSRLAGPRVGLFAAVAATGTFLMVRDAHFGVTDSLLTLWITLAAASAVRAGAARTGKAALAAGALAGLALGTKYNAALLTVPLLIAFVLRDRENGRLAWRPDPRRFALAGVAMLGVFLLTSPFILVSPQEFARHFWFEVEHLAGGHGLVEDRGWWTHLVVTLRYGMGLPALAAAGVGLVISFRRPTAAALVVFSFPLLYYLAIGRGFTTFARYMLPVLPFLCVALARAVDAVIRVTPRIGASRGAAACGVLVVLALMSPSIVRSIRFDTLLTRTDTREILARWWMKNLPPETTVGWLGDPWSMPLLYDTIDESSMLAWVPPAAIWREAVQRLRRDRSRPAYAGRWIGLGPDEVGSRLPLWRPPYLVVATGPLVAYTIPEHVTPRLLPERYWEKVLTIDPSVPGEPAGVYDQQDAFFVPLGGLDSVTRPGPTLTVYRLRGFSPPGAGR